jgi:polysaccharide biosynthesis transport protein
VAADDQVKQQKGARLGASLLRGLDVLRQGWPTILGAGTIAAVIGYAATFAMPTRYEAEARVLVDVRDPGLDLGGFEIAGSPSSDPTTMANHTEMLRSRDVARHVVQRLELSKVSEFDPGSEGRSFVSSALALVGMKRDLSRMSGEDKALEIYAERLSVTQIERTRVLRVAFTSRDPQLAANIANGVVERYLDLQARAKVERDRRAIQHRQRRIEELRTQLAEMAERITAQRARAGLPPLDVQGLPQTPLAETQREIVNIRREQDELMGRVGLIREASRQGRPVDGPALAQVPALRAQAEAYTALRIDVDKQNEVLLPQHPRMRDLRAQLTDLETRLRTEAERLARAGEAEAQRLSVRGEALRRQIADASRRPGEPARSAGANDPARQLAELEREFQSQREVLESWVQMHRAVTARDAFDMRAADARILAQATAPSSPSEPRALAIAGFAGLLGLLLSGAGVGLAAFAAARRPEDEYAFLASLNASKEPGEPVFADVAAGSPDDASKDRFFSALAPRFSDKNRKVRTLAFVTVGPLGEGTTLALALARKLALSRCSVVLVDLDARGEALSDLTGVGPASGLSDHLVGQATLGAVIHRDRGSRAHIVPSGRLPLDRAVAAAGAAKVTKTLAAFAEAYDHVVIDAGSGLDLPAYTGIDSVFLVAPASLPAPELNKLRAAMLAAGAPSVDIVTTGGASQPEPTRSTLSAVGGPRLKVA